MHSRIGSNPNHTGSNPNPNHTRSNPNPKKGAGQGKAMARTLWLGEERGRRYDELRMWRGGGGVDSVGPLPRRAPGAAVAEVGAVEEKEEEVAADPGVGGGGGGGGGSGRRR